MLKAKHAESLEVTGIVCLPDLFFKPKSADELVLYLKAVGQSAPKTPLLYYHTPSFTGVQCENNNYSLFNPIIKNILEMQIYTFSGYEEIFGTWLERNSNSSWNKI